MSTETVDYQTAFDRGVAFMGEGRMKDAVEIFGSLKKAGVTSKDLEANLGRALIDTGSLHDGLLHWHNALKLGRFDLQLRSDLDVAKSRVPEKMGENMTHPVEWAYRLSSIMRPLEISGLGGLFLVAFIGMIYLRRLHLRAKISLSLLVAVTFSLAIFASSSKNVALSHKDTELRSTPLESAQVVMKMPDGTSLKVLRKSGSFIEVERAGSFRGWVKEGEITPLHF